MTRVQVKRGTRAQLNAAAGSNGLFAGEVYLVTDENRLAVGLTASTYADLAKLSEAGGGVAVTVEIDSVNPYVSAFFEVPVIGAIPGDQVVCSASLDMPVGVAMDELESDPIAVSGHVQSADVVRLLVTSINRSPIGGKRNINVVVL